MATDKQKAEVLAQTKYINGLKVQRNRLIKGTPSHKAIVAMIKASELDLKKKRKKYKV